MMMGEYHHSLDEKNRLIIPIKFREELRKEFVITRGLEGCIFLYSLSEWKQIVSKLQSLPFTRKDVRDFSRFFLSGATTLEFDKQGRINITSPLITYANLTKNCVIIGVNDHVEIWSEERWNEFITEKESQLSEIAERLFDINIDL